MGAHIDTEVLEAIEAGDLRLVMLCVAHSGYDRFADEDFDYPKSYAEQVAAAWRERWPVYMPLPMDGRSRWSKATREAGGE